MISSTNAVDSGLTLQMSHLEEGGGLPTGAIATFDEGSGRLVVDGGERADVADELVQQRGLQQVRLLGDERLVGQHYLLGGRGVGGQQPPVDEAAVPDVEICNL